jgi:hypothetical protein
MALAALGGPPGCGWRPAVVEVEGVVKLAGKPLPHVRVQFLPDPQKGTTGPISAGATDDDGRFTLVCADQRPGAVVGWHRVVITDMGVRTFKTGARHEDDPPAAKQKVQPNRVPDKYTTAAQMPLSLEVPPEKQNVTLELTR